MDGFNLFFHRLLRRRSLPLFYEFDQLFRQPSLFRCFLSRRFRSWDRNGLSADTPIIGILLNPLLINERTDSQPGAQSLSALPHAFQPPQALELRKLESDASLQNRIL